MNNNNSFDAMSSYFPITESSYKLNDINISDLSDSKLYTKSFIPVFIPISIPNKKPENKTINIEFTGSFEESNNNLELARLLMERYFSY